MKGRIETLNVTRTWVGGVGNVREATCDFCGVVFSTAVPNKRFCSVVCRKDDESASRTTVLRYRSKNIGGQAFVTESTKWRAVMHPCPVCAAPGPVEKLALHILWDHQLDPDRALAKFPVTISETLYGTTKTRLVDPPLLPNVRTLPDAGIGVLGIEVDRRPGRA